ncbi:MAG: hypothetical protein H6R19_3353 [Proteobacteria bacterium]|nr:hypothetical protein [Pseudomonadota bacterium]
MNGMPALADQIPRQLRFAILASILLLFLCAGLLWNSRLQLTQARTELTALRTATTEIQQRYQKALAETPEIRQTLARFTQLRQDGMIGTENRLDWANALRTISQSRHISKFEFTLGPQGRLEQFDTGGSFRFKTSPMQLNMHILHEGDLLRILSDLRNIPSAMILPRHCKLGELDSDINPGDARLLAECTLDWVTVEAPTDARPTSQP